MLYVGVCELDKQRVVLTLNVGEEVEHTVRVPLYELDEQSVELMLAV